MSLKPVKRLYKEARAVDAGEHFAVHLDDRPLRTPAGAHLLVPSQGLARAIAEEWAAQEETIAPHAMPLTGLACTALDLVAARRAAVIEELADYGATDAICYRADRPPELVARQDAVWQPLVHWAADRYDARLEITTSILAAAQPEDTLEALKGAVAGHGDLPLAALATAVKASGSLVVGLALVEGRLDHEGAFQAGELHETYQIDTWGEDPEETKRREGVRRDLAAVAALVGLL
ncbi:MAG: ATP12 family protein [Pseudomonadota bacterium]